MKTASTKRAAASSNEVQIRDAATNFTENLLTYKHTTVDADISKALRFATDEFPSRPLAAFGGIDINRVKTDIKTHKGTSTVDVKAAAITSRDDDTATVVVVTNRAFNSDQRDAKGLLVIELTLVDTGDGWKVDNASSPVSAS